MSATATRAVARGSRRHRNCHRAYDIHSSVPGQALHAIGFQAQTSTRVEVTAGTPRMTPRCLPVTGSANRHRGRDSSQGCCGAGLSHIWSRQTVPMCQAVIGSAVLPLTSQMPKLERSSPNVRSLPKLAAVPCTVCRARYDASESRRALAGAAGRSRLPAVRAPTAVVRLPAPAGSSEGPPAAEL
jgi:hypothetical protein